VRRILVTGMSGSGKSTALGELRRRGYEVVDTDEPGWTEWSDEDGGYVWCEDPVAELLSREREVPLFLSGTVSNQGRFYPRFDAVVLLSAPLEVLLDRVEGRTTNDFGKTPEERERITNDFAEFEHRLRAACTHELDATQPIETIVAELIRIGAASGPGVRGAGP
jgi:thymidylate kinase